MQQKFDSVKINIGTKEELEIRGYRSDAKKTAITAVLTVLTGGLLLIPLSWRPTVKLFFTHVQCQLRDAQKVLVKDNFGQVFEETLVTEEGYSAPEEIEEDVDSFLLTKKSEKNTIKRWFINKKIKYIWDDQSCVFNRLKYLEDGTTAKTFHDKIQGLSDKEAVQQMKLFGKNIINIEVASVWKLLINQFLILFSWVFVCAFYMTLKGVLYKIVQHLPFFTVAVTVYSIIMIWLCYERHTQSRALKKQMTSISTVQVLRGGREQRISSDIVVPGDVILIGHQQKTMELDAVLLEGAVVTNEAMLTGESVPITKTEFAANNGIVFQKEDCKQHIVFSGTQILQVRGGKQLRAIVIDTGFDTTKGELVRSILFPKPMDFHIYSDFLKLIFIFFLLGLCCMCWSFYIWTINNASTKEIIFNSLDLLTFVIPPILPATITAINVWAQRRLKQQKIFCLSSNYISLAGPVDVACFDKTGTLTEDDLNIGGVLPCYERGEFGDPMDTFDCLPLSSPFTRGLATCHSLVLSEERLIGHPLDAKIFQAIDWELEEPGDFINQNYGMITPTLVRPKNAGAIPVTDLEVAVLKCFPFRSKDLRMTVLTRGMTENHVEVFLKGAPETIASLCDPSSVPQDFDNVLACYTSQGLRVIAMAVKPLSGSLSWEEIEDTPRNELEEGASFLGFIFLQNQLKPDTSKALRRLHNAHIDTVMITGDNLRTALAVAQKCNLVSNRQQIIVKAMFVEASLQAAGHLQVFYYDADEAKPSLNIVKMKSILSNTYVLAIDGKSFDLIYRHDRDLFQRIVLKAKVYARMKPDQKIQVIEELQKLGHQVAMCGDGCNDCGALKVAHAGISLSTTEASVAAPFTSQKPDIDCVAKLILEGRSTLVSIYASFKYNISYSFAALMLVLITYTILTEPSDTQYLIMDLVLITVPSLVLGNTGAPEQLVPQRPTKRILSFTHIFSIISFLFLQFGFYVFTWIFVQRQSWFTPYQYIKGRHPPPPSYEGTFIIIVGFYSFVIGAVVFSHGYPFRKPFYTNKILTTYLLLATTFCIFVNFCTADWFCDFMNFLPSPSPAFSGVILLSVVLNLITCAIWERWIIYRLLELHVIPWIQKRYGPHPLFIQLEKELKGKDWPKLDSPPLNNDTLSTPPAIHVDKVNIYDKLDNMEDEDSPLVLRKYSDKYKFKASVKYMNESKTSPSVRTSPIYMEPDDYKIKGATKGLSTFTGTSQNQKKQQDLDANEAVYQQILNDAPDTPTRISDPARPEDVTFNFPLATSTPHDVYSAKHDEDTNENQIKSRPSSIDDKRHSHYDVPRSPSKPLENNYSFHVNNDDNNDH